MIRPPPSSTLFPYTPLFRSSAVVAEAVRDTLPDGATLRDLGEHRLKDLYRPEHVWQLVHPELPSEFPPLRRSEEHTSELQSRQYLVCRLLLEKKKTKSYNNI